MKEYKIATSTFFNDNWTFTPIHWSGHDFDIGANTAWLYFKFNQSSKSPKCITNNSIYNDEIVLDIIIYANTELYLSELYDNLILILKNNQISDLVISSIDADSSSILKTTFGDFNYMDLSIVLNH